MSALRGAFSLEARMKTITEIKTELKRVRMAIARIEDGAQEYTIGNRRLTRADLATLYDRETALENELADAEYGGMMVTFMEKGMD